MNISTLKELDIPKKPGIYRFLDTSGILYIGKATSLRDRVRSYFGADVIETRGPHIVDMVTKATTISWEETDSVLEALILEANEIKKHQPYYNTKEKDNKSYNYVVITKEEFPRVLLVRGRELEKHKVGASVPLLKDVKIDSLFGPFPSGESLKIALRIIRKIFPFRDKSSLQKDKAEFYKQIGLAPDMTDSVVKDSYKNTIRHIKLFLGGKKKSLIRALEKLMMEHAKKEEFEKALALKKKIFALGHINDVALIKDDFFAGLSPASGVVGRAHRIESYDIAHLSGKNMVGVMTVLVNGQPEKSEYRKFTIQGFDTANDTGALKEVLERRFTHKEWTLPDVVVIDGSVAQKGVAEKVLAQAGLSIPVVSVVKNEAHKPKALLGSRALIDIHKRAILLSNSEAHRFAIAFYRKKQRRIV